MKGNHDTRYDVTILVNGLPLVHVELKRRGVAIREAFNQIKRYQRDSFWAASGLYEYVQIFIISNGTHTLILSLRFISFKKRERIIYMDEQKRRNLRFNENGSIVVHNYCAAELPQIIVTIQSGHTAT